MLLSDNANPVRLSKSSASARDNSSANASATTVFLRGVYPAAGAQRGVRGVDNRVNPHGGNVFAYKDKRHIGTSRVGDYALSPYPFVCILFYHTR